MVTAATQSTWIGDDMWWSRIAITTVFSHENGAAIAVGLALVGAEQG